MFLKPADTLLKRISENSAIQIQQLNSFKAALNELSEKLINNSNDFKQSVSQSFHTTSEALNKKQDEFRDKICKSSKHLILPSKTTQKSIAAN